MQQHLTNFVRHALGIVHAFPTACTNSEDILGLIRQLHPICTGCDLIRLGPDGDGGYLVPDDLEGIEACFSPGVSNQSGFEKDCATRGLRVFLADGSVEAPQIDDSVFTFTKTFVGATTSQQFMTLDDWVSRSCPGNSDLLLQMDIEGFEYETLLSVSDKLLKRFRIIVVEYHNLDLLWSRPFFGFVSRGFEKLLQTHVCVHAHPNNGVKAFVKKQIVIPRMIEMTFLRKDRVVQTTRACLFPHPLDRDNTPAPLLPLPRCWYHDDDRS